MSAPIALDAPLTAEYLAESVRASAFEEESSGRRLVHCFMGGFIGADWDEGSVLDLLARAEDVAWRDYPAAMGHHLCVVADGKLHRFQVSPVDAA